MYPELVLARYGKKYTHGYDCHERRNMFSQIPRNMKYVTLDRSHGNTRVGQEAEEAGETVCKSFYCNFYRKGIAKQDKQS